LRNHREICNEKIYSDDTEYPAAFGGSTKSISNRPLWGRLESIICEEMKLARLNPLLPSDVELFWRKRLCS